jgi:hypothetical protein
MEQMIKSDQLAKIHSFKSRPVYIRTAGPCAGAPAASFEVSSVAQQTVPIGPGRSHASTLGGNRPAATGDGSKSGWCGSG